MRQQSFSGQKEVCGKDIDTRGKQCLSHNFRFSQSVSTLNLNPMCSETIRLGQYVVGEDEPHTHSDEQTDSREDFRSRFKAVYDMTGQCP